jgi:hypothetical protein
MSGLPCSSGVVDVPARELVIPADRGIANAQAARACVPAGGRSTCECRPCRLGLPGHVNPAIASGAHSSEAKTSIANEKPCKDGEEAVRR